MRNEEISHIVNNTLRYKLNTEMIKAHCEFSETDQKAYVKVTEILGTEVLWRLTQFRIVDIHEYFSETLINDILDKIQNSEIWDTARKYNSCPVKWMSNEAQQILKSELFQVAKNLDVEWDTFFVECINEMGVNGYLNPSLYFHIVNGYFEHIGKYCLSIEVKKIRYLSNGKTRIVFSNDAEITIRSTELFSESHFFNELIRNITTENFLKEIGREITNILLI